MQESGSCEKEVKIRVPAEWNRSRKVLGIICDRVTSQRKRKSAQFSGETRNGVWILDGGGYKETSRRDGSCRDKNVEVCCGRDGKDKIRNEYISGTVKIERLGMKMREGKLRWYGHVFRRDQEYVGKRVMEMELPGSILPICKPFQCTGLFLSN